MKVLHVQNITGIAGSEMYLLNALPALKREGDEIHFLILHPKKNGKGYGDFKKRLEDKGIIVHVIPFGIFPFVSFLRRIHKLVRSESFDIVHTHLIHADFLLAYYKKWINPKIKLVSTKHGYEEWYNNKYGFDPNQKQRNLYYRIARFAETQVDASIAISKGLYELYLGLEISKQERLKLIHYGFDFPNSYSADESLRFSNKQAVLVGRLTPFKGHRYAVEAFKKVVETVPDANLVFVGSGPEEQSIRDLVIDLNLEDHVHLVGYSKRAREYMFNSDVVLVPSVSEGFGVVVLEAFSVKKPILAFEVPSLNEHIEDGKQGFLVPAFDVDTYADRIVQLFNNEEDRKAMGFSGYEKLKTYYNLDRMTNATLAYYNSLIV